MCGLAGFFTGCDVFADAGMHAPCFSCPDFSQYKSAFASWDRTASARARPRRLLGNELEADTALALPRHLIPVLSHPEVLRRDPQVSRLISIHHLYRYLKFTIVLETEVVGNIITGIACGQAWENLPSELVLDAHRIRVDEAYHALFSQDMLQQVRSVAGVNDLPYRPSFISALLKAIDGFAARERALAVLYFTIISETLITGFLKQDNPSDNAISESIHDHLKDELLHHHFFRNILFAMWPDLAPQDKDLFRNLTPDFITAFLAPDTEMIARELVEAGIDARVARNICMDIYSQEHVNIYIANSTHTLRRYLRDLGIVEGEMFCKTDYPLLKEIALP